MIPNYKIERVLRECQHNRNSKSARDLIYDFHVTVAGSLRAIWSANASSRGYRLYDPLYDGIEAAAPKPDEYRNPNTAMIEATTQKDFVPLIDAAFENGRVPSLEDLRQRTLGYGRALLETRELEELANRKRIVDQFSLKMYAFLANLESHCAVQTGTRGAEHVAEGQRLRARQQALISEVQIAVSQDEARRRKFLEENQSYDWNPTQRDAVATFRNAFNSGEV